MTDSHPSSDGLADFLGGARVPRSEPGALAERPLARAIPLAPVPAPLSLWNLGPSVAAVAAAGLLSAPLPAAADDHEEAEAAEEAPQPLPFIPAPPPMVQAPTIPDAPLWEALVGHRLAVGTADRRLSGHLLAWSADSLWLALDADGEVVELDRHGVVSLRVLDPLGGNEQERFAAAVARQELEEKLLAAEGVHRAGVVMTISGLAMLTVVPIMAAASYVSYAGPFVILGAIPLAAGIPMAIAGGDQRKRLREQLEGIDAPELAGVGVAITPEGARAALSFRF